MPEATVKLLLRPSFDRFLRGISKVFELKCNVKKITTVGDPIIMYGLAASFVLTCLAGTSYMETLRVRLGSCNYVVCPLRKTSGIRRPR